MKEINTKNGLVKIYAETIEDSAIEQIKRMSTSALGKSADIRIMPDAHAGAGCVIGTTMKYNDKVCPNLVGVDIGCGVTAIKIKNKDIDLERLDFFCSHVIPSGMNVAKTEHEFYTQLKLIYQLCCFEELKSVPRLFRSMGTLGGGNHYLELNIDQQGDYWMVVHTGSRNLGKQVAEFYQSAAREDMKAREYQAKKQIIKVLKESHLEEIIKDILDLFPSKNDKDLAYLTGAAAETYLFDMEICQEWAKLNRKTILSQIAKHMNWEVVDQIESVHNYIDTNSKILRKGAISAKKGEKCLIPLNMKDGLLICEGKGNADWNFSAPHGAGRLMSRTAAKKQLLMKDYENSMEGIYTTSVCEDTLDEAPFAYKDKEEIMKAIEPAVVIIERLSPVYNFKAKI